MFFLQISSGSNQVPRIPHEFMENEAKLKKLIRFIRIKTKECNPENGWFVDDPPFFEMDMLMLHFSNIMVCVRVR